MNGPLRPTRGIDPKITNDDDFVFLRKQSPVPMNPEMKTAGRRDEKKTGHVTCSCRRSSGLQGKIPRLDFGIYCMMVNNDSIKEASGFPLSTGERPGSVSGDPVIPGKGMVYRACFIFRRRYHAPAMMQTMRRMPAPIKSGFFRYRQSGSPFPPMQSGSHCRSIFDWQ